MSVVEYGWRRSVVVVAVTLAVLLQAADTTIVNVSLPTIEGSLGASTDEGTWLVTAYIIANVIVIPLAPWLQARFGRRNYFAVSIVGFTVLSALCGMATTLNEEIVLRFVQGAFGGGLVIPAQQILRDTYAPHELGKSQALFGFLVPIGPAIGPVLGGFLTDNLSWQWVFYVNVVPGIVACVLALLFVRDPEAPKKLDVDGLGIGFLAVSLGSLQYVLERGERLDWFDDPGIVAFSIIALIGGAAFVWWELRGAPAPAVNVRVLSQRAVWAGTLIFFCFGFSFYGMFLVQPFYTQQTLRFTTSLSGEFMAIRAVALLAMFPAVNWVVGKPRIDLRFVVAIASLLYALTWFWQASLMTTGAGFNTFLVSQVVGGILLAFSYSPVNVILMRALDPKQIAPSLALVRLGMQIGGSVGSAIIVTMISHDFVVHATALQGGLTPARTAIRDFVAQHGANAAATLASLTTAQATVLSQADAARLLGVVMLLSAPMVLIMKKHVPAAPAVHAPPPLVQPERVAETAARKIA